MSKKRYLLLLVAACTALALQAQVYNEMDTNGNITQVDEYGNFNPNRRDSTKSSNKEVPKGVKAWTVDRRFGDIRPAELDTMPHLYQNTIYNTGVYGEYNSTGNNYTPRQNRIFTDRRAFGEFIFVDPYDYTTKQPDQFLYMNTLSPYTNISYDNCGDKQNGEDHIDAKFGVNASKRLGFGFDLDYYYGRGYYKNQSTSHFRASLYGTYVGDRYQMHFLGSAYHRKVTENGGILNDNYITHPELETTQYSEEEIPTVLQQNWNRNNSQHLFLSHRYNFGFYRQVKMTDDEIKARQFAKASAKSNAQKEKLKMEGDSGRRPNEQVADAPAGRPDNARIVGDEPTADQSGAADTTRIKVESQEHMDSLMAEKARQDSIDATMKREYVPVTSIIHTLDINNYDRIYQAYYTPANYYADTFYDKDYEGQAGGDAMYDKYQYLTVKNTLGLALLEGFNKYMKAGLKGFVSYEMRNYKMPALLEGATDYYLAKYNEHCLNVGGQLSKTQGRTFHFNLAAELGVTGMQSGALALDFNTDVNFPLLGDTVRLAANAYFHRTKPSFFHENFMSKHLKWDQSLNAETRTHIEGIFSYDKTNTQLRFAVDELQNYIYYGMSYTNTNTTNNNNNRQQLTGGVYQESGNINVLTAQLRQNFRLGPLNWENVVTYQNSGNQDVLPLPDLNLFTNLYLRFKIARVLLVELGGCATYFTKYTAPDYLPQIGQFAIQQNADSRVEIGGYPFIDVYANMHLKRTRFFIAMSHVNAGSGSKEYFLTPHYPTNTRVLRLGVSWNFYN